MSLEDLTGPSKFIVNLVPANPTPDDFRDEGDDHIRGIKNVLKNSFPRASADPFSFLIGMVAGFYKVPARWVPLDGRVILEATYPLLFQAMGIAGAGSFTLPNTQGCFLRGVDPVGIYDANYPRAPFSFQYQKMSQHKHDMSDPGHAHTVPMSANPVSGPSGAATIVSGGSTATSTTVTGISPSWVHEPLYDSRIAVSAYDGSPTNWAVYFAIFADQ